MGCCFPKQTDDKGEQLLQQQHLVVDRKLQSFIKRINGMLQVILPECKRIVDSKDEDGMLLQIAVVLDQVIAYHHENLSPQQRRELLIRCVPQNTPKFREVVEKQEELARNISSKPDVDLMRMLSLWFEADQDNSGELELDEIRTLLQMMNVEISVVNLNNLVMAVDTSGDGIIQFDEFYNMYLSLTTVEPIDKMFEQISTRPSITSMYTYYDLERFLRTHQRMRFRGKDSHNVVTYVFGEMRLIDGATGITRRQFQNALLDPLVNSWFSPKERIVHQDMTQPLTHYFINSSHNTYLSGNQLNSQSSCEMYTMALREGCRCVEIDCWDGPSGDPIVYHGHTMTTKIRFYDVIKAIDDAAFATSPYPIILSLEVHTCPQQQDEMARIMKEIFGQKLLAAADAEHTPMNSPSFSPAGLLRKILIKAKRTIVVRLEEEAGAAEQNEEMGEALNELCYLQSKKFTTVQAAQRYPHYSIISVDERRMENWAKQADVFCEMNKGIFTRTYPKGSRFDSSNYNPQPGWNIGAQTVALNFQTSDWGMRLNRAKYTLNGCSGFILKPRCLRVKGVPPRSFGDRKTLSVTVICGAQLPKPKTLKKGEVIDPFVQLFISGIEGDDTSSTPVETKVIENNGFNPTWNETFNFHVNSVEMACLTLRILQKDTVVAKGGFIGENTIPLSALRFGYRTVPLIQENGTPIPSPAVLFCHFKMTTKQGVAEDDL